jgi:hypothetical protein
LPSPRSGVILPEALSNLPGAHADDGVLHEVGVRGALEDVDREVPFFEQISLTAEGLFDAVLEKGDAALSLGPPTEWEAAPECFIEDIGRLTYSEPRIGGLQVRLV